MSHLDLDSITFQIVGVLRTSRISGCPHSCKYRRNALVKYSYKKNWSNSHIYIGCIPPDAWFVQFMCARCCALVLLNCIQPFTFPYMCGIPCVIYYLLKCRSAFYTVFICFVTLLYIVMCVIYSLTYSLSHHNISSSTIFILYDIYKNFLNKL